MGNSVLSVRNVSKMYRLGSVGASTIKDDVKQKWNRLRGKPFESVPLASENVRDQVSDNNYVWALQDISFDVRAGETVGIIGANGAGKSTLLKLLSRVTAPTRGEIRIRGRIASLLEVGTGFHPELTGKENIYLNGAILGMRKAEISRKFDEIVAFAGVERYVNTPVKRYSSGMYVRLAFAVAAHLEPEILVIDEVLAVGDVEFQNKCLGKMKEVAGEGRTILFVSHNIAAVQNLCTRGIYLEHGKVKVLGTSAEAVAGYLKKNNAFVPESFTQTEAKHRNGRIPMEMEILSVAFLNPFPDNDYAGTDPLEVELELLCIEGVSDYRIALGIYTTNETGVAAHFTQDQGPMNKGERCKLKLTIQNHQLAKGTYYFNFAVGIGNPERGVREYDIVEKVLFMQIAWADAQHTKRIAQWDERGWGHMHLQNVAVCKR